jgi:thiamine-phosphate diphosphorylase
MRPLPRLLAVTTDGICEAPDFAMRAAAIAEAGPAVGLLVRAPGSTAAQHTGFVELVVAVARPHEAQVFVHARPDLGRAVGAQGVQLRRADLPAGDARRVLGKGWIGVSVHGLEEAQGAIAEGADFLLAGNLFETASHPDRPAKGLQWLGELCALPCPVIAIGGITPARAAELHRAGAWGVAAVSALWLTEHPGVAAAELLSPWMENA